MSSFVQTTNAAHKVVIYSKTWCGYCRSAKSLFARSDDVEIVELDTREDGGAIQVALMQLTGQRTVPNVFIGGQHVGGNDDCQRLARQGKLQEMLAKL